jgi:hypothetical protein
MVDGFPRLTDRFGKSFLLVEAPPSATVIQFYEMTQSPACGEQLPLGMLALDLAGQGLGHAPSLAESRKKKIKTGRTVWR